MSFTFLSSEVGGMFSKTAQADSSFISILYSLGNKPLQLWEKMLTQKANLRRITDDEDIYSGVLELVAHEQKDEKAETQFIKEGITGKKKDNGDDRKEIQDNTEIIENKTGTKSTTTKRQEIAEAMPLKVNHENEQSLEKNSNDININHNNIMNNNDVKDAVYYLQNNYITCPSDSTKFLDIRLKNLILQVKRISLSKEFSFEIHVLDDKYTIRRIRLSTYQEAPRIKSFLCHLPLLMATKLVDNEQSFTFHSARIGNKTENRDENSKQRKRRKLDTYTNQNGEDSQNNQTLEPDNERKEEGEDTNTRLDVDGFMLPSEALQLGNGKLTSSCSVSVDKNISSNSSTLELEAKNKTTSKIPQDNNKKDHNNQYDRVDHNDSFYDELGKKDSTNSGQSNNGVDNSKMDDSEYVKTKPHYHQHSQSAPIDLEKEKNHEDEDYEVENDTHRHVEEKPEWNVIQLNLDEICRLAYGTSYLTCLRITIHANCRIRRVFFAQEPYNIQSSTFNSIDEKETQPSDFASDFIEEDNLTEKQDDNINWNFSQNPNHFVKTFGELKAMDLPFEFQLFARVSNQERKEHRDRKRKKSHE